MSRAVVDTSVFIARESGPPIDVDAVPDELAVSVITIGELRAGVLAAEDSSTRVRRLDTYRRALTFDPVPVDESIAESWAYLRVLLEGGRHPHGDQRLVERRSRLWHSTSPS